MDLLSVIFLGVVEGITEFIPVSSTGHLILFGAAIGFKDEAAVTFKIFIQLGAIMAVLFLYYERFFKLFDFSGGIKFKGDKGFKGAQGMLKIFLACLPAFIIGPLVHAKITAYLFDSAPVALALIFGGVVMITLDSWKPKTSVNSLENLSYLQSFGVGVFQCLALWPGMSRSGSTIIGGMLLGLGKKVAAEFSFLVAVPIMAAAVTFDLWKNWAILNDSHLTPFLLGFAVSMVTGVFAIKLLLKVLDRYSLRPFGYYRVLLGFAVIAMLLR